MRFLRSSLIPCFVSAALVLSAAAWMTACNRLPRPAVFIRFDGDLLQEDGRGPSHTSGMDFAKFRDRRVVGVHPGSLAAYNLAPIDLREGTLEFWVKLDTLPPNSPSPLVQLSGEHGFYRASIDHTTLLFESGKNPQSPAAVYRSKQPLTRGAWTLLAFRWNTRSSTESLLMNGDPVELESSGALSDADPGAVNLLQIGLAAEVDPPEDCEINLRDLRIWPAELGSAALRKSYRAQADSMSTPLAWSAVDLFHFAGVKVQDAAASGGWAWTSDTLIAALDPIALPAAGDYTLTFRVKPLTTLSAGSLTCRVFADAGGGKKTELAHWENQAADLRAGDAYLEFTLPFHAAQALRAGYEFQSYIPSKYSILLDSATLAQDGGPWRDTRRFEELRHTMGVWHEDPDAARGKGWANANTLHYGPYAGLGLPGKYRVTWRIKIAAADPPGEPLLLLDVFSHDGYFGGGRRGNKSYAKLALSTAEFQRSDSWETKSLDFNYDGCDMMEFRAFAKLMRPGAVTIDTVTVQRLE